MLCCFLWLVLCVVLTRTTPRFARCGPFGPAAGPSGPLRALRARYGRFAPIFAFAKMDGLRQCLFGAYNRNIQVPTMIKCQQCKLLQLSYYKHRQLYKHHKPILANAKIPFFGYFRKCENARFLVFSQMRKCPFSDICANAEIHLLDCLGCLFLPCVMWVF